MEKFLFNYPLDKLALIFVIYAFIGWCVEVIYATVRFRRFVNRGFLNGPYCPVYGFSIIVVLGLLLPIENNLFLFLIGSIILTTLVEFIAGLILEKSFSQKWWDYSGEKYNIKGYICLRASIIWGLSCIFVAYFLHPVINKVIGLMSNSFAVGLAIFTIAIVVIDTVISIYSLLKVKQKVQLLDDIGENIRHLSDTIGKNISDSTIVAMNINDNNRKELNNLNKKYQSILEKRTIGYNRIAKAFPSLNLVSIKKPKPKVKQK